MSNKEIDTQVKALLDITNGNYVHAIKIVCLDITMKESLRGDSSSNNYCG